MRGVHQLVLERRGGVPNESAMIAKLHGEARRRVHKQKKPNWLGAARLDPVMAALSGKVTLAR